MDRRLLMVLGTSLLVALALSAIFYQIVMGARKGGTRQASAETRDLVVASRALPFGAVLKPADVKLTKVLANQFPADGFAHVEEVLNRPVISSILPEEPVREGRLARRGSGLGLAPIIPEGMRAVSVRVNDVVGVAGYVLPGMRVDVLITGRPGGQESVFTKTILQDILVLSAGQNIEPDGLGKAINAPVVTLLVTPEQAEVLTLASEGRIQLVLRNPNDRGVEKTPGRALEELYHVAGAARREPVAALRRPAPPRPAAPLPPPVTEDITVIRGNQKTVEQVAIKKLE
ncbi:MAG: Flp pilus assembly protein CpaB [Bryobacteraceae bacterium]|jgi:pilus assembly protein CpaB